MLQKLKFPVLVEKTRPVETVNGDEIQLQNMFLKSADLYEFGLLFTRGLRKVGTDMQPVTQH
jgi:hypothetical protein